MALLKSSSVRRAFALQSLLAFVTLLFCEVILWSVVPIPAKNASPFSKVMQQSLPGLHHTVEYSQIGFGARARSLPNLLKQTGEFRILCVGGSTTDQPTQHASDTWCGRLEYELNMRGYTGVRTVSYGYPGATAFDTGLWLHNNIDRVQPDLVVTLLGINDLTANGGAAYKPRLTKEVLASWAYWLEAKFRNIAACSNFSQICRYAIRAEQNWRLRAALKAGSAVEWHSAHLPSLRGRYKALRFVSFPRRDLDPHVEFGENVNWIATFIAMRKLPLVVLGQPTLWSSDISQEDVDLLWAPIASLDGPVRPASGWLDQEMKRYNSTQAKVAIKVGAVFVDLDAHLEKSPSVFFDDAHFTDFGSHEVARIVAVQIAGMLSTDGQGYSTRKD